MAHTTRTFARPLRSLLHGALLSALGLAIASPVHAAPAAAPIQTGGALPGKPIPVPAKQLRLRMILEMNATTDVFEGGGLGNTEDEIYYSLTGMRIIDKQLRPFSKMVRPTGAKDIWEMGPNTNDKLRRVLFAGKLEYRDSVAMNVVIGEQDNAEIKTFTAFAALLGESLGQLVVPGLDIAELSNPAKQDVLLKLVDQTTQAMEIIGSSKDQIPGSVAVTIVKHKLKVSAPGAASSVISQDGRVAHLKLTGDHSNYTLTLVLEPTSEPNPANREYLDSSEDNCSQSSLRIPKSGGGSVIVHKGERKDVAIPAPRYAWHCGDDDSPDWSTAPAGTNIADTRRVADGDEIRWRWYRQTTPSPDLTP